MPDVYDIDPRHRKFETSREPDLKLFSFRGEFEDNMGLFFDYFIKANYEEMDGGSIMVYIDKLLCKHQGKMFYRGEEIDLSPFPTLGENDLYWIISPAIQDYLKITGTIHFESKLEL